MKQIIILLGVCSFIYACGSDVSFDEDADVLRPVRTMTVTTQNEIYGRVFTGTVAADKTVDLAFRVSGTIKSLPVREGDEVKENTLIAKIDQTDFQIQVDAAKAEFDRAESEFKRATSLLSRKLIPQSDYDKLKAQLSVARANLSGANQNIEYSSLTAPFSGFIAARHVENHSEISAGTPVVTLSDLSSLVIQIDVPETVMMRAGRGTNAPELFASFEGIADREFPLSIKEVETQADPATQTYKVSLSMEAIDEFNILPGMSASVRANRGSEESSRNIIYVPSQTVLEDEKGRYVYLLTAESEGVGVVRRRDVTIQDLTPDGLEVKAGLASGEKLITAGMTQLHDGMRVRN